MGSGQSADAAAGGGGGGSRLNPLNKLKNARGGTPVPMQQTPATAGGPPVEPGMRLPWEGRTAYEGREQQFADQTAVYTGSELLRVQRNFEARIATTEQLALQNRDSALKARRDGRNSEAVYYHSLWKDDMTRIDALRQQLLVVARRARNIEAVHAQAELLHAQRVDAQFMRAQLQRNPVLRGAVANYDNGEAAGDLNDAESENLNKLDRIVQESIAETQRLFNERQESAMANVESAGSSTAALNELDGMLHERVEAQALEMPHPSSTQQQQQRAAASQRRTEKQRRPRLALADAVSGHAAVATAAAAAAPQQQQQQTDDYGDDGSGSDNGDGAVPEASIRVRRGKQQQHRSVTAAGQYEPAPMLL